MGDVRERQTAWTSLREAMARGDARGWLRGWLTRPMPAGALFAALGEERRALVAELRRAAVEAHPHAPSAEAERAIHEVEVFFDAVHAAACDAVQAGDAGREIWPWAAPEQAGPGAVPAGALGLLHDTGRRLLAELDLRKLLPLLVDRAAALTRADVALLAVWNPETGGLEIAESRGIPPAAASRLILPPGAAASLARLPGARIMALAKARWLAPAFIGTDLEMVLLAPLVQGGALWGLLACGGAAISAGDDVPTDLASVLAGQVAIAVRNAALYREALGTALELHEANERLRGLDLLKDHFLATVSHELRTPLTWITGFGSLLIEEPGLSEEHRYYVQKMLEGAFQLLGLVNDLLDYSRMQEGRLPLRREPFAPGLVAQGLHAQYEPVARQSGLTLDCVVAEGLPTLFGDPERLGQVLGNLLGNALKFTPPGGGVAVRVGPAGGPVPAVRFEVTDTGPGIRLEDQGRLFERFAQLDPDPARRVSGTGLGLAISRGLIEAHGGEIGLTSPVPGMEGGCMFWFEIPVAPTTP